MPPAARVTDPHICPSATGPVPHVGGPILPAGCPEVLINGLPAARVTDMVTCVGPPASIILGSTGVMIGGLPAARFGDPTSHGGKIVFGSPNVMIGETGEGSGGAAGLGAVLAGLLWSGLHAIGLIRTQADRVAEARNFFAHNQLVENGVPLDTSKMSDQEVLDAFNRYNEEWKKIAMTGANPASVLSANSLQDAQLKELSPRERQMAKDLEAQGRKVEIIPRSDSKTPDFLVDGKQTELKSLEGSGPNTMKNAIQTALKQSKDQILIDARGIDMTPGEAVTQIQRVEGNVGSLAGRIEVWTKSGILKY